MKGDDSAQKSISELQGKKVCAFCGIANPDSFRKTLSDARAQVLSFDIFPDHHRYSQSELEKIKAKFIDCRADFLISTQKDGARLQEFPEFLNMIYLLRVEMEIIPKSDSFKNFILDRLAIAQKNKMTTRMPCLKEKLIINLIRHIPLSFRRFLACLIARLSYYISLKHRLIAIHNLMRSFPDKSLKEIIVIAKESYAGFVLVVADFFDIPYLNKDNLHRWISIEGLDNYTEACKEGKGVLIFSAHFGNWEIGNAAWR